jgi:pyridoxine 5-phosphate synthase
MLTEYCAALAEAGVRVSLFIDADPRQLDAAAHIGAPVVELHTGHYADAVTREERQTCLKQIARGVEHGVGLGLQVNAGHGLDYHNVQAVAAIEGIVEFNIGHSIISRAVFSGLHRAVADMKRLLQPPGGTVAS